MLWRFGLLKWVVIVAGRPLARRTAVTIVINLQSSAPLLPSLYLARADVLLQRMPRTMRRYPASGEALVGTAALEYVRTHLSGR
jgi:hypothetical protein